MKKSELKWLFNFAVSPPVGGGFQRLEATVRFFQRRGNAVFLVSEASAARLKGYSGVEIIPVRNPKWKRLLSDDFYLRDIRPDFDIFFSYGIPNYRRMATLNVHHISNVLMLSSAGLPDRLYRRLEMALLKHRILRNLKNADCLSGESGFTLDYFDGNTGGHDFSRLRRVILPNGLSEELFRKSHRKVAFSTFALTIGTQPYRNLIEAYKVYRQIPDSRRPEKFIIVGDSSFIPGKVRLSPDVLALSRVKRSNTERLLKSASWFISSSKIENCSVADLEGMYLSERSLLSPIPSRKEVLQGVKCGVFPVEGSHYHSIRRQSPAGAPLWNRVLKDFTEKLEKIHSELINAGKENLRQ